MTDPVVLGFTLLSLALFISVCLNVILCIRRKVPSCKGKDGCCFTHIYTEESPSHEEGHYFYNLNHDEQQENPPNHHEQQENPIYGNISSDRRDSAEVCYEMMTMQHTRDRMKQPLEPDVNYASLDIKVAKKRMKKNRYQQGHAQGRSKHQDEPPVHLTPPASAFFEVEADMDAHLPPRDTSTMVSQSSIYLNSQQIAQETEELERERVDRENVGWQGMRRRDEGRSRGWKREQENEDGKDGSNGSVCTQLSDVEDQQL